MGRRKTYKVDSALDKVMELFWKRGYQDTSVQVVAGRPRAQPIQHLRHIRQQASLVRAGIAPLRGRVSHAGAERTARALSPRDALVRVFELAISGGERKQRRDGCLLIDTAIEMKHSDSEIARIVGEALGDMEGRFREVIERGKSVGEICRHRGSRLYRECVAQSVLRIANAHSHWCCRTAGAGCRPAASAGDVPSASSG